MPILRPEQALQLLVVGSTAVPEAMLRNSFPAHTDKVRRVIHFDYVRLLTNHLQQKDVETFDVKDYVLFG